EESDSVSDPLSRQQHKNVLLVGRPDAKAIQFHVVSKQEFEVFDRQERGLLESVGDQGIQLIGELFLDRFLHASLVSDEPLQLFVSESLQEEKVDIQRWAKWPILRAACLSERHPLVPLNALVGSQDDVEVPPRGHGELLPQL